MCVDLGNLLSAEGKFAAQQQAKAIGKQASRGQCCVKTGQLSFVVSSAAKQCAVSQSIFTEDKEFAC